MFIGTYCMHDAVE